jgi:hypothetical protein
MIDELEQESEDPFNPKQSFEEGRSEFIAGRFFEAHDIWEEFWHRLHGRDRRYLQGLIHLAVGAYHFENGNLAGARSQFQKAATKLSEYPHGHWGINVRAWTRWIAEFLGGNHDATLPKGLPYEPDRFPPDLPLTAD